MENWVYSEEVKDHFMNPRNILSGEDLDQFDGVGREGSIKCGDEMMVVINIDKNHRLKSIKFN